MSNVPENGIFDSEYYDAAYFAIINGKKFKKVDGTEGGWGYSNPSGRWDGCGPIAFGWRDVFGLVEGHNKMLDVGCGRGQFIAAARRAGIEAWGFDFSVWAVGNKYVDCDTTWITCHDATKQFPYGGNPFDLVVALDIFEHLYDNGDIDKVIDEIYRVCKIGGYVFLQIATVKNPNEEYLIRRGEKIPLELEGMAVAGHVTVKSKEFWIDKLLTKRKWKLRDDLVAEFIKRIDPAIIDNWVKNTIIIIEKEMVV